MCVQGCQTAPTGVGANASVLKTWAKGSGVVVVERAGDDPGVFALKSNTSSVHCRLSLSQSSGWVPGRPQAKCIG